MIYLYSKYIIYLYIVYILDFLFFSCHNIIKKIIIITDQWSIIQFSGHYITFTFMHLADAFIQSDLQYIQAIHLFYQYVCSLGIEPTTFCAANAMLYH